MLRLRNTKVVALGLFLFVLALASPAIGEKSYSDTEIEHLANAIFSSVNSPFCPGRLLQNCPSTAASELKEKVREKLRSGMSEEEVFDELFALYGDSIRATPDSSGVGLLGWFAPFIFLLLGLFLILTWLAAKKHHEESGERKGLSEEDQRMVERELKKFDL